MKKQSVLIQGINSALDELELLFIEAENLDLDVVMALQKRFKKLQEKLKR